MSIEIISQLCDEHLNGEQKETLKAMGARLEKDGASYLEIHFASLPRKIGRSFVEAEAEAKVNGLRLASMRHCDLAASELLVRNAEHGSSLDLFQLYDQGDALERRMILKALNFLPGDATSIRLLQEAHRTNDEEIFRAAYADTALPAAILDNDDFYRGVLKSAFMNLEYDRLLDVAKRATEELSEMLLEFMSEREAAGRKPWPGSLELASHAPSPGVLGRVAGDIQHGDDARRLHAVRGAGNLIRQGNEFLVAQLKAQGQQERNAQVKSEIANILSTISK